MRIVKLGTTERFDVNKGSYKEVRIILTTIAAAANTPLPAEAVDLSQINAKAVLIRGKQEIELFNDTLDILVPYFHGKRGYYNAVVGVNVIEPAAGVFAERHQYIHLDFQGILNVTEGDDKLIVEITTDRTKTYPAGVDSINSLVEFDIEAGVGYETHVAQIITESIKLNEKTLPLQIGDNIMKLMFINTDKTTYQNPVIKDLNFVCDRLSYQKKFTELVQMHLQEFDTNVYENQNRGIFKNPQNIILFDGVTSNGMSFIHDVSMKVNFNEANVAQGKNWIAYTRFMQDERQLRKARELYEKHKQKNANTALTSGR